MKLKQCIAVLLLVSVVGTVHAFGHRHSGHARKFLQASATNDGTDESVGGSMPLNLTIASGSYYNYLLRDNTSAAAVLLNQPDFNRTALGNGYRLLVAFPAGNAGAALYFNATSTAAADSFRVELAPGSLTTVTRQVSTCAGDVTSNGPQGFGVQGELLLSGDANMTRAVLGSVRTLRDYIEGPRIINPIFAFETCQSGSSVVLSRRYINGTTTLDAVFEPANANTQVMATADGNFTITATGGGKPSVTFYVVQNEPQLHGLSPSEMFVATSNATQSTEGQQASFLAYREKFLAGSWRFLTYFGRDTLISLRLFMSQLAPAASEAAIASVLERLNTNSSYIENYGNATNPDINIIPAGTVAHEETLGDYASYLNIERNRSDLGASPVYDYKMVDSDWLLMPTTATYLLDLPQGQGRGASFLSERATMQEGNVTYDDLLVLNAQLLMNLSAPFAAEPVYTNLIRIRGSLPVGNWRDSNKGLAGGTYPYDVNTALVPAGLRAIARLAAAGLLSSELGQQAAAQAAVWEERAAAFFRVELTAGQAERLVTSYANAVDVPINGSDINGTSPVHFYALSLYDDGSKAPALHSDVGFNLLYMDNPSPDIVATVPLLLSPYPVGLLTGVGMVVASPAYASDDPNFLANFTRADYHGTVVWSWQQALMLQGIERQLGLCQQGAGAPDWCADMALQAQLQQAAIDLWSVVQANKPQLFEEVWSWTYRGAAAPAGSSNDGYVVTPLGDLTGASTESNAVQLWSYAFLATEAPQGATAGV